MPSYRDLEKRLQRLEATPELDVVNRRYRTTLARYAALYGVNADAVAQLLAPMALPDREELLYRAARDTLIGRGEPADHNPPAWRFLHYLTEEIRAYG